MSPPFLPLTLRPLLYATPKLSTPTSPPLIPAPSPPPPPTYAPPSCLGGFALPGALLVRAPLPHSSLSLTRALSLANTLSPLLSYAHTSTPAHLHSTARPILPSVMQFEFGTYKVVTSRVWS